MRIIIAFDSFKDSLPARAACEAFACGIRQVAPDQEIDCIPLADGGEGTIEAVFERCAGQWITRDVMGPLPHLMVEAGYATFEYPPRALIETATASGLELLRPDQRDPLRTTTYGTGQLIRDALDQGRPVAVAVGGSATVDGGVGAALALGFRFLDQKGRPVAFGAAALETIDRILPPPPVTTPEVTILADVNHVLCGPEGAARIFGPQKGLRAEDIDRIDAALQRLAGLYERDLGRSVAHLAGSGAAGGLAAGLAATLGARIVSGAEWVRDMTGLPESLRGADWVVTGEGRFDATSLRGKVVSGVLDGARQTGARVSIVAGRIACPAPQWTEAGIAEVEALSGDEIPLESALRRTREALEAAGAAFARRRGLASP